MEAVLKPRRVWLAVLGVVALALAGLGAFAAIPPEAEAASSMLSVNLKWGRPTQAERDTNKLFFWNDPATGTDIGEILVYVDGLESGKTYEIEVVVTETGGPAPIRQELKVQDLIGEEVPAPPPADPRD